MYTVIDRLGVSTPRGIQNLDCWQCRDGQGRRVHAIASFSRKADVAFKAMERAMKKAEAAVVVCRMAVEEAQVWKHAHARTKDRLVAVGGLTRARGRKALGVGEYAA